MGYVDSLNEHSFQLLLFLPTSAPLVVISLLLVICAPGGREGRRGERGREGEMGGDGREADRKEGSEGGRGRSRKNERG